MSQPGSVTPSGPRHAAVRPRYARIAVLLISMSVTLGVGIGAVLGVAPGGDAQAATRDAPIESEPLTQPDATTLGTGLESVAVAGDAGAPRRVRVPAGSGDGRRVVFDMSEQRVWLVGRRGRSFHTYLVSGSRHDNLQAGTYEVYSRSLHATGYTGASTMDYMVRFTSGENAAIGFHDIPVDRQGHRVQTVDELGTATSAGCIRQRTADAKVMWRFADVGTTVVVID